MTVQQLTGDLTDPDDLEMPRGVRTPGRTWTEFPVDRFEQGIGTVRVDGPTDDIDILTVDAAIEQFPDLVEQVLFSRFDPSEHRIAAYHAHFLDDALFVRIPSGTVLEDQITVTTTARKGFYPHHVAVYVEPGASARIVERNEGDADCDSSVTELHVAEDAHLAYNRINALGDTTGYADNHATVADSGTIDWLLLSTGADLYKNRVKTWLDGPRSTLQYRLGFLAAQDQHMDITTRVVHNADNTRCDMDSRGVAMDSARTVYKGVQEVKQAAEGTQSFQDENTVMIGNDAEADTSPQLQIDNNDVEATHAATTGHISPEDLFYMTSRGIREGAATREIVQGMFDDLIDDSPFDAHTPIRGKIDAALR